MHPNPAFRKEPRARNIGFARDRAFGTLAINGQNGPLTAHIPFLLDEAGHGVELHLARSNPIVKALQPEAAPAVITVLGPDGYISPDWYGVPDQVPTWNYISIRIEGVLETRPPEELHAVLNRLSAHFEDQLLPNNPWTSGKMTQGVMERMMRAIVPFYMKVTAIEGTWKLNQNKALETRDRAADHVKAYGIGTDLPTLSALMKGAIEKDAT